MLGSGVTDSGHYSAVIGHPGSVGYDAKMYGVVACVFDPECPAL